MIKHVCPPLFADASETWMELHFFFCLACCDSVAASRGETETREARGLYLSGRASP